MMFAPVIRKTSALVAVLSAALLTGCHADITCRLDLHADKTVTTTLREVVDDQMYTMAANQSSDPFGETNAQGTGWNVSRSTDENNNHIIVMTKTSLISQLTSGGGEVLPGKVGSALPIAQPITEQGLFTDRTSIDATIPALIGQTVDANNPYSAASAAIAASILSIHLVVKTPGTVSSTNGETTADGATSWTVSFTSPTKIHYAVDTPDIPHIVGAVVVAVVLLFVLVFVFRRRRPSLVLDAG